jgi:hypothetical protein
MTKMFNIREGRMTNMGAEEEEMSCRSWREGEADITEEHYNMST